MSVKTTIIGMASLGVLLGTSAFFFKQRFNKHGNAAIVDEINASCEKYDHSIEIRNLTKRVRSLELLVTHLNSKLNNMNTRVDPDAHDNDETGLEGDDNRGNSLSLEQVEQESREASMRESEELASQIDQRMENEGYSAALSKEVFEKLSETLIENRLFESKVISVNCSTSTCKIEVEHQNPKVNREQFSKINGLYPPIENPSTFYFNKDDEEENNITVVYLSRNM